MLMSVSHAATESNAWVCVITAVVTVLKSVSRVTMVLLPETKLMSMGRAATGSHVDVSSLGYHLRPCWYP